MNLLEGMQVVKTGPSLREKVERWIAGTHHNAVVGRLRRFRERVQKDMSPEPWTLLECPLVVILSDLADVLGLDEAEKVKVLGGDGLASLAEMLEIGVRPVPAPWLPMNVRQSQAMRYTREHGEISLGIYRQICPHWSDETLRLDLANLVARGLLVKSGANRGTRYELPEGTD